MNKILFGTGLALFFVFLVCVARLFVSVAKQVFESRRTRMDNPDLIRKRAVLKKTTMRVWLIYVAFLIIALIVMLVFQGK
jgi:hypothetical protein